MRKRLWNIAILFLAIVMVMFRDVALLVIKVGFAIPAVVLYAINPSPALVKAIRGLYE